MDREIIGPNKKIYSKEKQGKDMEKELTLKPRKKHYIKCKDHLGIEYGSLAEMCRKYEVDPTTYKNRIKRGWSAEEALDNDSKRRPVHGGGCKDHLGNIYPNQTALADAYGITRTQLRGRLKKGLTLEEALTLPAQYNLIVEDYKGKKYKSLSDMAKAYNIEKGLLRTRIKKYGNVEKAYERKQERGECTRVPCKDHLGKEFASMTDMCKYWKIDFKKYRDRIKLGWTLEDALTEPDQKDKSAGEKAVEKILKKKKIKYEYDKRLADIIGCPRNKNRQRVDFYLNDYNAVIEFDGRQHFEGFGTTKCTKEMLQDRDKKKEKILLKNKIPVLRIKHNQFDKIQELIEDLISEPEKYLKIRNKYLTNKE